MEDLSLHILDIAENSIAAKADKIEIRVTEDEAQDLLSIEVIDNGAGMDQETVKKALDPFYTSKTVRRFGFGLSLLSEAAKAANGQFWMESKRGEGTKIKADFQHSHIDRQPLGDIAETIITLIMGNPEIAIIYVHKKNDRSKTFDTRNIQTDLGEIPINSLGGIRMMRKELQKILE